MHTTSTTLKLLAGGLAVASAFSPSSIPALRPATRAAAAHRGAMVGLSMQGGIGSGAIPTPEELTQGRKMMNIEERSMEEWLEKFSDSRNSMRAIAAKCVAADYDKEGNGDEIIKRLIGMIKVEDVNTRRGAVQCLGLIGEKILDEITDLMLTTDDMMVRASCAKIIGAVALKNPDSVESFPQKCLDAMVKAATEIPDPITKLSIMSGLSQIGTNNERALDAIILISQKSDDVALLTQCMNTLGTIAESKPEWKGKIKKGLEDSKKAMKDLEGAEYVLQMVDVQLEKVMGDGFIAAAASKGGKGDNDVALEKMKGFFSKM